MGQNDRFRIDSHKLIYHPQRVADWAAGQDIFPIYMEISPTGMCNLRCVFCSVDFMGYRKLSLDTTLLKERLSELGSLGLKSIMYAGEGEPFLHPDFPEIIAHTKEAGIDAAVTTNGVLMKPGIPEKILGYTEWIKVSLNAGSPETYAAVHRARPELFETVLSNMEHAVAVRAASGHRCTLGAQILLLPENELEVESLARRCKDIGLDYLVVKPYTHHQRNAHDFAIQYKDHLHLAERLSQCNDEHFKVVVRLETMRKWDEGDRPYKKCLALPFWSYIDAAGNVWGCSAHLEDERFLYGNIASQSFRDIWLGEKRRQSLAWTAESLDIETCKLNCRMDAVNRYLDELKNPIEHVNFI